MTMGIFNNPAPLQFCGCQIKEIILYKHLNLPGLLESSSEQGLLTTWSLEIRIYFHLLCNYMQINWSSRESPPTATPITLTPPKNSKQNIFVPNSGGVSSVQKY